MTPWRLKQTGSLRRNLNLIRTARACAIVGVAAICAAMFATEASGQQRSIPSASYFGHFPLLHAGEYREALQGFRSERGIRTVQSRWIDSICIHTMTGECYYKLGQYGDALDQYTAALNLYLAFSNWMVQLRDSTAVAPAVNRPRLPWGQTTRNAKLARVPAMLIQQGRPITERDLRKGGVIASPTLHTINAAEIVRCTCLAMMRRAEILGPLSKHDTLTDQVLAAASLRQGIPNHWSQAWLDAQLGFANVAAGNAGQALGLLKQSCLLGGEMDHPITGLALLQMGKISLEAGKLPEAALYFEEASYTAAEHNDFTVMEEAFRYGSIVHAMSRPKNVFAALEPAAAWATKRGARELQTSLLIQAAESAASIGQTKQAVALLTQAKGLIGRRIMAACEIGARLQHITALTHYQLGAVPVGDDALNDALRIYKNHCPWLYQLALTSTQLSKGGLSAREAVAIFERLADDPTPTDWVVRPLDCLAVLSTPHHAAFEQWFEASRERELETALEVAERARRHRFYSALPLGGRLLALRWLLESHDEALDAAARLQRQDLQSRYPAYVELGKRATALRAQLKALPLVPNKENADELRKQDELLSDLNKTAAAQEVILREIALRREPANFCFPPMVKTKDVQAALPSGTVLLNIFATSRQTYATLLAKEKYATWNVDRPDVVEKKIVAMLRAMGNHDGARELPASQFAAGAPPWQQPAREAIESLLKGSKVNFAQKFDELVVVPDGVLWYLPFEAVHVGDPKASTPLLDKTRVRYAPTMGLAFTGRTGRIESPEIGLVTSKAAPRDEGMTDDAFLTRLKAAVPRLTVLNGQLTFPSPLYASLLDGLIVLDDVTNTLQSPFDWSPIPLDRQKGAGALGNWLSLPWKTTDVVVVTGFHTPSENGLKDPAAKGQDLFLASCAIMATGARTVVLSRWRTGGQSSRELVRQFVQELPFSTAAEAWQRAVQLVRESPLDVANEPRVRNAAGAGAIDGQHPFFWAGYLVLDSGVVPRTTEADPTEPPALKLEAPIEAQDQKENLNGDGAKDAEFARDGKP
jgi:tetratricopeptide (TPR) repeat protein